MKKFNRVILLAVLLSVMAAAAVWYAIYHIDVEEQKYYKVEINRIYNGLSGTESLDELPLDSYDYVKNVTWIPIEETRREDGSSEETEITEIYEPDSRWDAQTRPWYEEGKLKGWLCFEYQQPENNSKAIFIVCETVIGLLGVFIILLLVYLKHRLILPFHRMSHIPGELAQGHMKWDMKEEKSKYFGQFIWGLGQLKDSLEVTKKRELQLEKEKKKMLLSLSHDIKMPLNTIKLYVKALEDGVYETDEERDNAILRIGQKTTEIEQYVQDIMKTSREDLLNIQVEDGEFYLSSLIDAILSTYNEKCKLRKTELIVEPYENCLLKGDIQRSREVIENIFENAFKYGDGRRIVLQVYEEDYCHLIRIFNTGIPVTDHELNHIFESFFQGANSTEHNGSGLGLYICREIMRKMGGEIFAQKEDDGMAFTMVFR